ncbi:MAG: transglutaminase family protein [Gammaproteobacteria bacterium]|nr:transglutaminase family protein [Gammaproteobacteria bacterium]MBT8151178.1 transglutaminase family protein [Gammaproteobacteria bacterium]NNM10523.1 transglutaminase family protein [Pseudomonadales bacterium]
MNDLQAALRPTSYIDSEHPGIAAYAAANSIAGASDLDNAVKLYYAVRDDVRYNPYNIDPSPDGFTASAILQKREGWCVPKAILLAACVRRIGIPAKVGFADVVNHLSSEKLRERMGSDLFIWHGYTALYLEDQWVKATPAFNIELCEKAGIHPLEFDGRSDSIYHAYDKAGNKHMEYKNFRGEFDDVPREQIMADLLAFYGQQVEHPASGSANEFANDVQPTSR